MKGTIILENGVILEGRGLGFKSTRTGEFIFNTAMTGYQEILTDPSYKGQFVVMTYPHIGNVGVNEIDNESGIEKGISYVEGFIVRELSTLFSNYRAKSSLEEWLTARKIVVVDNVDTRKLTRIIREKGSMMGVISNEEKSIEELKEILKKTPSIVGQDLIKDVSCKKIWKWNPEWNEIPDIHTSNKNYDGWEIFRKKKWNFKITVLDCGVKWNILRILSILGNEVTIVPASSSLEEIIATKPDGILISNGPGDPAAVPYIVKTVRELINMDIPVFGICFGHQLIGQALGGKTFKLKFGHHGANHPVKNMSTKHVEITSQNHNFCLDIDSLDRTKVDITHIHLNDNTVEGLRYKEHPVFSVQYHPESSPGPHDSRYLFINFMEMIDSV